jgi:hypothetical protein
MQLMQGHRNKADCVRFGQKFNFWVDNGKGMSETDARMAFERHATSKIQQIEDLFRIKTMGFSWRSFSKYCCCTS